VSRDEEIFPIIEIREERVIYGKEPVNDVIIAFIDVYEGEKYPGDKKAKGKSFCCSWHVNSPRNN